MTSRYTESERPILLAYGNAVVSAALAVLARLFLEGVLSYHHPFATFYVAVLWVAWYGGFGPALVTTGLGALAAVFLFLPPLHLAVRAASDLLGIEFYFAVTISAAVLIHLLHKARFRVAQSARLAEERLTALEREIIERVRAEQRLRKAEKFESIGLVAGGIAHDFNNLLTGIIGNTSIAMHLLPVGGAARNHLDRVMDAAERSAELVSQLLAYAGNRPFIVKRLQISEVALEAVYAVRPSVPENVEVQLELQPELPSVQGDPAQYQQMAINLISNAVEATAEKGGLVVVGTGRIESQEGEDFGLAIGELTPGTYVFFEVSDTGPGIPREILARIFDPFFTTKFVGRGLGLAAVAGIVRSHGGAISVVSNPGEGSRFTVYLQVTEYVQDPAAVPLIS